MYLFGCVNEYLSCFVKHLFTLPRSLRGTIIHAGPRSYSHADLRSFTDDLFARLLSLVGVTARCVHGLWLSHD
jgi:hypothetical protein